MAQKIEMVLVDDLDGAPADETVLFGVDGRHYEIDLSVSHAKQLRKELKAYVGKARTTAPPSPQNETPAIRQWARDYGYEVSTRGRIQRDIIEEYRNAATK